MRALVAVLAAVSALAPALAVTADENSNRLGPPAPHVAATPVTACADPPPTRTGQLITEKRQSLQLAMALGALAETAPLQFTDNPSTWWCSEKELTTEGFAMQVWRSTRIANGVTSVQRIAVRERSVTLYVVFSVLASGPLNKDRRAERLTWRAHVLYGRFEGGWAVYRMFDGEPDPEIVAPLVADVVDGKVNPIAYMDGEGIHFGRR